MCKVEPVIRRIITGRAPHLEPHLTILYIHICIMHINAYTHTYICLYKQTNHKPILQKPAFFQPHFLPVTGRPVCPARCPPQARSIYSLASSSCCCDASSMSRVAFLNAWNGGREWNLPWIFGDGWKAEIMGWKGKKTCGLRWGTHRKCQTKNKSHIMWQLVGGIINPFLWLNLN